MNFPKKPEQTMTTALIPKVTTAAFDEIVMERLLLKKADLSTVKNAEYLIGLVNDKQEVYRVIGAYTKKQYDNVWEELDDYGLEDEHNGKSDRDANSYNASFGGTIDEDEEDDE